MNKYWVLVLLVILGVTSCATKDEHYYQMHPEKLQQALKACAKQPQGMTCQQLESIAKQMNALAYQLQRSPQGFGKKIMVLQDAVIKQQEHLKNKGVSAEVQNNLDETQRELSAHLAVVKWLESPAS